MRQSLPFSLSLCVSLGALACNTSNSTPTGTGTGVSPVIGGATTGNTGGNVGNSNSIGGGGEQVVDLLTGNPNGTGTATLTGTVDKTTLAPATAVFDTIGLQNGSQVTPVVTVVALSSNANFCNALLTKQALDGNSDFALLVMGNTDAQGNPNAIAPGTFAVTQDPNQSGPTVDVSYEALDPNCIQTLPDAQAAGNGGQVVLQTMTLQAAGQATGTFNINMGTGSDVIQGQFTAAPCPGLYGVLEAAGQANSSTPLSCQ